MAEATVGSLPMSSQFFCHECQQRVQPNNEAFTCSRCNSEFIEEVEGPPTARGSSSNDTSSMAVDPTAQFAEMLTQAFYNPLRASNQFMPPHPVRHRYNTRQASSLAASRGSEDGNAEDSDDEEMWNVAVAQNGERPQRIINYVIQRLSNDLGRGGGGGTFGVQLHGNPGDYAWGTGGLDVIISQLLNQLEGTGAPPAQRETIDSLPKVQIQQSHIDSQLQCSICMDDFELGQEVHKLPCDHLYHSDCIVKWLEMHGTCPVCRKDLNGEDTSRNEASFSNILPSSSNNADTPTASSSSTSMDPSTSSSFSVDFDL